MKKSLPLILLTAISASPILGANLVTHIPLDETGSMGRLQETISKNYLSYTSKHKEFIPGAVNNAVRFDGYSTYIEGKVPQFNPSGASTFTVWVAPETYPIVVNNGNTNEKITIAGTINHEQKSGWAFSLSKYGRYSFDAYISGNLVSAEANDLLPCYEWSYLVAVNDPSAKKITLYRNGENVGEANNSASVLGYGESILTIGMTYGTQNSNTYSEKAFNGLIDDVCVYDGALSGNELAATPANEADLSIPSSRFESDLLRPKYHGMPGANWTNETHGMTYSDGKYHVFFQKNANGPFMSRLHWGHISSENLYDWTEEKIAIAPGESYDLKGCWSGAVFTDEVVTGGKPGIIYTGVDYQKAYIVQATPTDESLIDWEKDGVIINGRPTGLSADFRDPYFFRNGNDAYIIVGTSKNDIGATTLHKYNSTNGTTKEWSNDGKIFFAGTSASEHGTFWEMPNITPMGDGKWLFTVTPQETNNGVHTIAWIGTINNDGTFSPISEKCFDIELVNGQGYGLLSPTIYQRDGKTIMMGIVPDKLPTEDNCELGWAHLYSFPREISIDGNNNLVQKPYSGLTDLRSSENSFAVTNITLDGVKPLEGVSGRQVEIKGTFIVGNNPFGFNLFKNSKGAVTVTYNPSNNRLEVNLSRINRKKNDASGLYACVLPEAIDKGSDLTLDVWVDGSIMDIFVNEKWATSIRVFPTDPDADSFEAFSTNGATTAKTLNAWVLKSGSSGTGGNGGTGAVEDLIDSSYSQEYVNVYGVNGLVIRKNVREAEALIGLPKGIYIVNGKKISI